MISLAVGLVLWTRLRTPLGTDHDLYHNRVFTCVRVLDGDTLELGWPDGRSPTTRVRLLGVDTPETTHGDQPAMHFGPEAAAFTLSRVDGRPVRILLPPHETRDRYHRLLGYIELDDGETMLNEELIRNGRVTRIGVSTTSGGAVHGSGEAGPQARRRALGGPGHRADARVAAAL